ncbi:hypothetical protein [Micromonospora sp. WMMD736]|uniref:hypothetical protein n=1 Tax=Micromonospora sp. WMMD736 TaxID=3404112 RepID=UPI003B927B02
MTTDHDRRLSALWYAWGQIDSGAHAGALVLDDGWEFARDQEKMQRDYNEGRRYSLPSILSAWDDFVERKRAGEGQPAQPAGLTPTEPAAVPA